MDSEKENSSYQVPNTYQELSSSDVEPVCLKIKQSAQGHINDEQAPEGQGWVSVISPSREPQM